MFLLRLESLFCVIFFFVINNLSGSRNTRRACEFGRTYVVRPKGQHQATIVWLHGLGDKGSRYIEFCFLDLISRYEVNTNIVVAEFKFKPNGGLLDWKLKLNLSLNIVSYGI